MRARRSGRWNTAAAGLAGAAMLTASCSAAGPGPVPGPGSTSGSTSAGGLAYAACMRAHGVANFPDPSASDAPIVITPSSGIDITSPRFTSARRACQRLAPEGQAVSQATVEDELDFLKFSICMRAHGLPDFPDPKIVGNAAELLRPPGNDPSSNPANPQFQAAWRRCAPHLPGHAAAGPPAAVSG